MKKLNQIQVMTTNSRTMNTVGLTAQAAFSHPHEPSQPFPNNQETIKPLSPIKKSRNLLTHFAHSAVVGVVMLAATAHVRGVTETDQSANFAEGSTGYQANVPATGVNLLALPGTTVTPSGEAPATPSLDPDRAYVGTSSSWSTLTDGSVGTVQGWLGDPGEVYIHDNWTLTYTFDSPRTIGDMDVFTRWSDGGRRDPRVTIKYSTDGSNFTSLHAINYAASGNCAWVHLSDILVPGVVAVQFVFGAQQNGAVGYAELCVQSGVTETDASASFAPGSTGYQANVPAVGVNLLALPGTTVTPSGAAPATPNLDPDRAYVGTSGSWSTLTDGSVGTVQGWLGDPGEVYIHDNWTLTYTFDSPRTIGDMDVFTRWSDGGRRDPRVTIKYSTDGSNFTSLHAINYAASGNCAWVHLTGILVPGVVAVQFAFGEQQNSAVGYAELCVQSGAPSGLVAAPLPSSVRLDWTQSPGATGYQVYRGTATGSYATDPVGSTTGATTYTDTGLTAGVPYYYVVKATNSLGASAPSNEASATPTAAPVDQTITFALGSTVSKTAAEAPFADTATAYPSGLPVTYSVPTAEQTVATVDSSTGVVTLTGVPGTAHIVADAAATAEYNAAQASQTLTVTQATTVITWPTPAPIEVGTPLSATQLNASSGGVDGTFTYDPASGATLAVGTQTLSVQFTPANTVKFSTPAPKTVSLLVIPVPPALINLAYQNSMNGIAYSEQKGTATFVAPLAYSGTTWNDGGNGSAAVSNLKKSDGTSTGISVSAVLRPHATGVAWGSIMGGNKLASYPAGLALGSSFAGDSAIMSGFVDILTFSGLATDHTYNIVLVDPTGWSATSLSATFQYLSQSARAGQGMADWVSGKNYALLADCIPNASGEITIQETISHDWSALCGFQIVDNGVVPQATPPFSSWITAYYATPSDPNAAPDADPDGDGLKNSVEYVLGTLPNTSNQGGPSASTAGGNLVFTFQRALASKNPDTKVAIEVSTDLGVWIAYDVDTAPEVAVTAGLDADHETVTLTLPMTPDTSKFARLRVAVTPAP